MTVKEGDRVRVYGNTQTGHWKDIDRVPHRDGTIVGILDDPQWINIEFKDGIRTLHIKQCRKLVKKVRREFWIRLCNDDIEHDLRSAYRIHADTLAPVQRCSSCEVICVREVKEKK